MYYLQGFISFLNKTGVVKSVVQKSLLHMIEVNVGVGEKSSTIYTCDLTAAYVDINTNYKS